MELNRMIRLLSSKRELNENEIREIEYSMTTWLRELNRSTQLCIIHFIIERLKNYDINKYRNLYRMFPVISSTESLKLVLDHLILKEYDNKTLKILSDVVSHIIYVYMDNIQLDQYYIKLKELIYNSIDKVRTKEFAFILMVICD